MADFMNLMQQVQQAQGKLQQMQQDLQTKTIDGASGGGMVTVTANGQGQVTRIRIDPSVVDPNDVEMLEDLVLVAISDAQKRAAEMAQDEMQKLTGGLPMPFKMPF